MSTDLRREYWHSGHLTDLLVLDLDDDGFDEILACGVDAGRRRATLVVLDPRTMKGAAVQPPGDPTQLLNLPPGNETVRVFFPRTAVNEANEQYNLAQQLYLDGGTDRR